MDKRAATLSLMLVRNQRSRSCLILSSLARRKQREGVSRSRLRNLWVSILQDLPPASEREGPPRPNAIEAHEIFWSRHNKDRVQQCLDTCLAEFAAGYYDNPWQ